MGILWNSSSALLGISAVLVVLLLSPRTQACTGFYATGRGRVLAGNNEDGSNPETKV